MDVVTDMSTEKSIRFLKQFAAGKGIPRKLLSDNGNTFKAAAQFMKSVFKEDIVQTHLSRWNAEWVFNLEKAPWWGGAYERMVKSTKRWLTKMVGRCSLSLDELYTALTEVESILNSRPLTYMSASDMEEPLTPSHLLLGRRVLSMPDHLGVTGNTDDEDFTAIPTQLNDRVKRLNGALNFFWARWRYEYLLESREDNRRANNHTPLSQLGTWLSCMMRACVEDCGSLARSMNSLRVETARFGVWLCDSHLELGFYVDQSSCCTHWKCTVIAEALLPTI